MFFVCLFHVPNSALFLLSPSLLSFFIDVFIMLSSVLFFSAAIVRPVTRTHVPGTTTQPVSEATTTAGVPASTTGPGKVSI